MVNDQLLRLDHLKQVLALERMIDPKSDGGGSDVNNDADRQGGESPQPQQNSNSRTTMTTTTANEDDEGSSLDQQPRYLRQQSPLASTREEDVVDERPSSPSHQEQQQAVVSSSPTDAAATVKMMISPNASPVRESGGVADKVALKKQSSNSSSGGSPQHQSGGKRRSSWRHLLTPSYKSRSDEFHKLFCDKIPKTERLIADYACALHREILIQGRVYISVNYIAFYSNLFSWITKLVVRLRDVQEIYKANTARIIPNAIQIITTSGDKHVFASFVARDKSYIMMLRIWQNNLMDVRMTGQEVRDLVHFSYGKDLGMSDNEELKINSPDPVTPANIPPSELDMATDQQQQQQDAQYHHHLDCKSPAVGGSDDDEELPDRNNNSHSSQQRQRELVIGESGRTQRYKGFDFDSKPPTASRVDDDDVIAEVVSELTNSIKVEDKSDGGGGDCSPAASSPVVVDTPPIGRTVSSPVNIRVDANSDAQAATTSGDDWRLHTTATGQNRHSLGASSTDTKVPVDFNTEEGDWPGANDDNASSESAGAAAAAHRRRDDGEELLELTTHCACEEHQGQLIADQEFDINVDTLFTLIFTNSKFMRAYMIRKGMTDTIISGWKRSTNSSSSSSNNNNNNNGGAASGGDKSNSSTLSSADGRRADATRQPQRVRMKQVRQLNYSMNINHMWAKEVQIEERQNICQVKAGVYVLKSQSINSGIPYGETFTVNMIYCLTRNGDLNKSRMLVHSFVEFNKEKQSWKLAMVKSMIERQSLQGVSDFIGDLTSSVREYIDKTLEGGSSNNAGPRTNHHAKSDRDAGAAETAAANRSKLHHHHHHHHPPPPIRSRKSSVSHGHSSGNNNNNGQSARREFRHGSLARAKSKLKEEKLKSIYRHYIHSGGGDVEGGPARDRTESDLDWLDGSGASSLASFSGLDDNNSMMMILRDTEDDDQTSEAGGSAGDDSWGRFDSSDRSFSDVDNSCRSSLRRLSRRHSEKRQSSTDNNNWQTPVSRETVNAHCSSDTRPLTEKAGGQLGACLGSIPQRPVAGQQQQQQLYHQRWCRTYSLAWGNLRLGTISVKSLSGFMIVTLLFMLFAMILSHVVILRRLDSLETRLLRVKCEQQSLLLPTERHDYENTNNK